jgi:hypothetical protein
MDYIVGKIIELLVYELQLHQADIEAAVLEQIKNLTKMLIEYMEQREDDKADDESA